MSETFQEYMYRHLVSDGTIDEDDYDAESVDYDFCINTTDIDEDELRSFAADYIKSCKDIDAAPDFEGFDELGM